MNVLSTVHTPPDAARIAHSVIAYDRKTEELDLEMPVPLFLDTLALKIVGVPPEDKFGALSYGMDAGAVDTFRFLLGLDGDMSKREYFLESTACQVASFEPIKLTAVQLLSQVSPNPRYARTGKFGISERELVLPTLRLLDDAGAKWVAASEIIARLAELFAPAGRRADLTEDRRDAYFSQKIRTMISHRDQPWNFISMGLAKYEQGCLRISHEGRSTVRALLS